VITASIFDTPTFVDTPSSQTVNQYQTSVTALLNGGTTALQETFAAPFSDSSVQNAIAQADALFAADGATFGSPMLTLNSTALQSSVLSYVATSPSLDLPTLFGCGLSINTTGTCGGVSVAYTSADPAETYGPATIMIGVNGTDLFTVLSGQEDINVIETFSYNVDRNATTTNTYLTTQSYVIDGTTQGTASSVPEPASAGLVLLGIGAAAWWRRRRTI
jgi:hypothetical protein